jgi:alkanesulfonate monooxygenase SsuD/methylene tetrahydromethanopterin reductase-like flavin-dependent oxidoreductase (luciferase family)
VRIAQLAEAIELIRAMWTQHGPVSFRGEHYQIADAHCESRPDPVPPIMVGGHGEKHLLRVVARHADWWNYSFRTLELYAHKQHVLQRHCQDAGRDYAAITQVIRVGILIAESERELEKLAAAPHVRPMEAGRLVGTPAQVTEALRAVIAQGAHRLTVHFADAPRPEGTWLFSAAVLPHL